MLYDIHIMNCKPLTHHVSAEACDGKYHHAIRAGAFDKIEVRAEILTSERYGFGTH